MAKAPRISSALRELPDAVIDYSVSILGTWTVLSWLCVFVGASFDVTFWLTWVALALGVGVGASRRRHRVPPDPNDEDVSDEPAAAQPPAWKRFAPPVAFGVFVVAGVMSIRSGTYTYLFGASALYLLVLTIVTHVREPVDPEPPPVRIRDLVSIGIVVVASLAAIWTIHVPAIDDAYYVNEVIATLQSPGRPILGFDGIHGDPEAPLQQLIHRPQTYEILVAFVSRTTGASHEAAFYGLVPALFTVLAAFAQWRLLRTFVREHAWLALPILFFVLASWTSHKSFVDPDQGFGKYAYVRMFHGKSVYMTTVLPMIIYEAIRYARRPSIESFVGLTLTQCVASMATSTALVISPIVAATAVLGSTRLTLRGVASSALGGLASVPVIGVLLLVRAELAEQGPLKSEGPIFDLWSVFGQLDERGGLVLLVGLSLPMLLWVLRKGNARWLAQYQLVCMVLVANPWAGPFLAKKVARLFSFRLYWTVPLPHFVAAALAVAVVLAVRGLAKSPWSPKSSFAWRLPVAVAVLGVVWRLATVNPWPHENRKATYEFSPFHAKRPQAQVDVIEIARPYFDPELFALTPSKVGKWLSGYEDRPKLVACRTNYTRNLTRHWGGKETRARRMLMAFASGGKKGKPERAAEQLSQRCVNVVILGPKATRKRMTKTVLRDLAFGEVGKAHGYTVWVRDELPEGCPSEIPYRVGR